MIKCIDHYNLRSDEKMIETLKDFYINVVGLKLGHRPPFKSKGYWLYADAKDILHLSKSKDNKKNLINVDSTLDHVSFSALNLLHSLMNIASVSASLSSRSLIRF